MDHHELSRRLHVSIPPFLKCPVCLEVLSDPRMLACTHTICSGCLDNLARFSQVRPANNRTGKVVRCPECRTAINVTADEAPPLNRGLAAAVSDWKTRVSKERLDWFLTHITTCSHHGGEGLTANIWCSTCQHNICNFCRMDDGHSQHTVEDIHDFESFSIHRATVLCRAFETHERLTEVTSRAEKIQNLEAAVTDARLVWAKSVDSQEEKAHQVVSTKFKAIRNLGDNLARQQLESLHREGLAGLQTLNLIGSCLRAVPTVMQRKEPSPDSDMPILELVSTVDTYLDVTHDRCRMKIQDFVQLINTPLTRLCALVDRFASNHDDSDGRPLIGRRWYYSHQSPGYRARSRGHSPRSRQQRRQNIIRIVPIPRPAPTSASAEQQPMQQDEALDLSLRPRTPTEAQSTANVETETTSTQTVAGSSSLAWPTRDQTQNFSGERTLQPHNGSPNSAREEPSNSAEEGVVGAAGPLAEDAIQSSLRLVISNIVNNAQQTVADPSIMSHETESPLSTPAVASSMQGVNEELLSTIYQGASSAAVAIISPFRPDSGSSPQQARVPSGRNENNSAASSYLFPSESADDRSRIAAIHQLDMPSGIVLSDRTHQSDSADRSTDAESPVNRNFNNSHGVYLQGETNVPLVLSGYNNTYVNANSMYHVRPDAVRSEGAESWSSPVENTGINPSQLYSPLASGLSPQGSSLSMNQQSQMQEDYELAEILAEILDPVDILYGVNENQLTFHGSHGPDGSTYGDIQPRPSTSGQ